MLYAVTVAEPVAWYRSPFSTAVFSFVAEKLAKAQLEELEETRIEKQKFEAQLEGLQEQFKSLEKQYSVHGSVLDQPTAALLQQVVGALDHGRTKGPKPAAAQPSYSVPVRRTEQALQGRAAGVQVTQNSGQPGSTQSIRIRGTGSLNNAEPLWVVDGIPSGGIDYLNPSDIESISVLKDAASAAIYGARGGNGVILVTTKKGAKGQPAQVTYDTYYGFQEPWKKIGLLNAEEYAILMNESRAAAGLGVQRAELAQLALHLANPAPRLRLRVAQLLDTLLGVRRRHRLLLMRPRRRLRRRRRARARSACRSRARTSRRTTAGLRRRASRAASRAN